MTVICSMIICCVNPLRKSYNNAKESPPRQYKQPPRTPPTTGRVDDDAFGRALREPRRSPGRDDGRRRAGADRAPRRRRPALLRLRPPLPHPRRQARHLQGALQRRRAACSSPTNYVAALACDPTEKKPFFHLLPGSDTLTFGMLGCDLHCAYCFTGDTVVVTDRGPMTFAGGVSTLPCASSASRTPTSLIHEDLRAVDRLRHARGACAASSNTVTAGKLAARPTLLPAGRCAARPTTASTRPMT